MNIHQIVEALGIPLRGVYSFEGHMVGQTSDSRFSQAKDDHWPTTTALMYHNDQFEIQWNKNKNWDRVIDLVLHEACHAVCPLDNFNDEGPLMVLQYYLIEQLSNTEEREICRFEFSHYSFEWEENGKYHWEIEKSDEFINSLGWKKECKKALDEGTVVYRNGQYAPVFGQGINSDLVEIFKTKNHKKDRYFHILPRKYFEK